MILWFEGRWRGFSVISSLSGRRGQMESRLGPRQPGEAAVAASVRQESAGFDTWCVLVCYFMCVFTKPHQMFLWTEVAEDLFPNCFLTLTALQKFTSKCQNSFCFLSARELQRHHFYQQIKITTPIIIIKHVLSIEFLNNFCPWWVYDLWILEPLCF